MNKILFVFFSLGLSHAALAAPKVGDFEIVKNVLSIQGKTAIWEERHAFVAYDAKSKTYTLRTTTYSPGKPDEITDKHYELGVLMDEIARVADIYRHCSHKGGHLERIRVPAGQFTACKLVERNSHNFDTKWYVPGPLSGFARSYMDAGGLGYGESTLLELHLN